MKSVIFGRPFFYFGTAVILLWLLSVLWHPFLWLGYLAFLLLLVCCLAEYRQLKAIAASLSVTRQVEDKLSLSDYQDISYHVTAGHPVHLVITDELPSQLQYRDIIAEVYHDGMDPLVLLHTLRPTSRGDYDFGAIRAYCTSGRLGLLTYMKTFPAATTSMVYPSIIQMRKYALQIFAQTAPLQGVRRVRKIGENDEFEHLRQYRTGDNIKSINWKATSRKGELIVNQYQDTRSQKIYCVLDKGRSMEMPFDGLSLLDYSINTILSISNIILRKYDKAGLVTFSKEVNTSLSAENNRQQLDHIARSLYAEETDFAEPNWEGLHYFLTRKVRQRSILMLFTNFEHQSDLERALPFLRAINQKHLLITISFKNADLERGSTDRHTERLDIYAQTIAQDYAYQKWKIIKTMRLHGIQTIYTRPEDLTVNVINKYLEVKAKRMK